MAILVTIMIALVTARARKHVVVALIIAAIVTMSFSSISVVVAGLLARTASVGIAATAVRLVAFGFVAIAAWTGFVALATRGVVFVVGVVGIVISAATIAVSWWCFASMAAAGRWVIGFRV